MATASVTYTFVSGTTIASAEANTNFSDLVGFINTNLIQKDASVAFTQIPAGPASNPTTDNQFARKAYVDAGDLLRVKDAKTSGTQAGIVGGSMTHGTHQLLVQGATTSDTTDAFGGIVVTFPAAFPHGVLSVVVCNGNNSFGEEEAVSVDHDNVTTSGFVVRWTNPDRSAVSGGARRTNWIAIGW